MWIYGKHGNVRLPHWLCPAPCPEPSAHCQPPVCLPAIARREAMHALIMKCASLKTSTGVNLTAQANSLGATVDVASKCQLWPNSRQGAEVLLSWRCPKTHDIHVAVKTSSTHSLARTAHTIFSLNPPSGRLWHASQIFWYAAPHRFPARQAKNQKELTNWQHTHNFCHNIFTACAKGDSKYLVGPFNWGQQEGSRGQERQLLTVRYQLIWVWGHVACVCHMCVCVDNVLQLLPLELVI